MSSEGNPVWVGILCCIKFHYSLVNTCSLPFPTYQALDCLVTQASPCMAPSYWPITPHGVVRLSVSLCHFRQCSCQQKGWGKVGGCHPDCDWTYGSYLSAWLWKDSFSTGWALCMHSHPTFQAGSPFPAIKACFSARTGSHCLRVLIESLFISGCVRVTDLFRIAWNFFWEQFEMQHERTRKWGMFELSQG